MLIFILSCLQRTNVAEKALHSWWRGRGSAHWKAVLITLLWIVHTYWGTYSVILLAPSGWSPPSSRPFPLPRLQRVLRKLLLLKHIKLNNIIIYITMYMLVSYGPFQKHANSEVQKPTDICISPCCQSS